MALSLPLQEFWRLDLPKISSDRAVPQAQYNRPAVGSGQVYCGGLQSEFVVASRNDPESTGPIIDRSAGAKTGHLSDSSVYYNATPDQPEIYFGGGYGVLYGFAADDGSNLWSSQFTVDSAITSTPVALNDVVYFATNDGQLYAVDRVDGSAVWSQPVDIGGPVYSTLEAGNGTVYCTTLDGKVVGINTDRTQAMSFDTGTELQASSPVFYNGTVFVAADVVYALNTDGTVDWRSDQSSSAGYGGTVGSSPVVDTSRSNIYVGSADGSVYAFDTGSGTSPWETSIGNAVPSTPALTGNQVVAATRSGDLVVLDAGNNGAEDGRVAIGSKTLSSPTVDNGEVFIGTQSGDFVGFR